MYRYMGNKSKILTPLLDVITKDAVRGETFCDPMCGTASVSAALAESGFRVVAADILSFPALHAMVRIQFPEPPPFDAFDGGYLQALEELNHLAPEVGGHFWQEYSDDGAPAGAVKPRKYFTGANAAKIDAIRSQIHAWFTDGNVSPSEKVVLLHDLIMAVNRVANIAGTYGHYRSTFSKASIAQIELVPSEFNNWASLENEVLVGRVEDLVPILEMDYLYLDPPYIKRQYAANYHILETIACEDFPTPVGESGLRQWRTQYSDFCSKTRISEAFDSTLGAQNYKKAFVSYSEDGLLSEDAMAELLGRYGTVAIHKFGHRRFRSNNSNASATLQEFVFEVTPA